MSAEVPLKTSFDELSLAVNSLAAIVASLPQPVELTTEEKEAIQTVMALITRLIGGT